MYQSGSGAEPPRSRWWFAVAMWYRSLMESSRQRLAPGWRALPVGVGVAGTIAASLLGRSDRLQALIAIVVSLLAMAFLDAALTRLWRKAADGPPPAAGLSAWLSWLLAALAGAGYVLLSIALAPRGLTPAIGDPVALALATAVGAFARGDRAGSWWSGIGVGVVAGVVSFPLLPRTPALAGIDEPEKGALAEITWHIDGVHVLVDRPLDPLLEHINGEAIEWTPLLKWHRLDGERRARVEAAARTGESCLDLASVMGEDGLVETLSLMDDRPGDLGELFECPAARAAEIAKQVARRRESQGEEAAAEELLASGDRDRGISRARLAVQIHARSGLARALLAHGLLQRGVEAMRTGRNDAAIRDLEEAGGLLSDGRDRGIALLALGKALAAAGRRREARNAFHRALSVAPGTATARAAEALLRGRPV
jgi:tetratricopeptide (TPR) repeat protein